MILADTSVWIDHFRFANPNLTCRLEKDEVCIHAFVIGELACGNLKNRKEILTLLQDLPKAPKAEDLEVLALLENHRLMGRGLGLIDLHLLATCLVGEHQLWTMDKALQKAAIHVGIGAP